jgi:4,5-dihydroxyphthalate decarboxylase
LIDGAVGIDAVEPAIMTLTPEEMFFRAMRHEAFDVSELSLSSFTVRVARGDCPYVGIPAFVSRAFRHTSVIVRKDARIATPKDLEGKRVGLPEWQLTANVWARGLLAEHYGVDLAKIAWVRGGIEESGRLEKVSFTPPPGVRIEDCGPGETLSGLLLAGKIDAFMGPRPPRVFTDGHPNLRWLFDDPTAEANAYFAKTRIYPIMHLIGLRKSLAEAHPWLPMALLKAFERSKEAALAHLADTSATKVMLPFVEERLAETRALMGREFWPYGLEPNRRTLEVFARYHRAQGLSAREVSPDELFHPGTRETYKL